MLQKYIVYAKQNTKYAKQNIKYAKQNTKYTNQKPRMQFQSKEYAKETNIDLRCFVAKQFLSQIYARFWRTFYRPKQYGGVPKMTNMRYVHEYWLSMAHLEIMTNSDLSFSVLTWPDWIGWSHGRWVTRSMQLQCLIWIKGGNRRWTKVNLTARLFYAFGHAKRRCSGCEAQKVQLSSQ